MAVKGKTELYHVWEYLDKRRRTLRMVSSKTFSRHDPRTVPAVWRTTQAATAWATVHTRHGFRIFRCDCTSGTGMGDHSIT